MRAEHSSLAMKIIVVLLNNVISILDLFKILTYYIDDKKILEIRIYKYFLEKVLAPLLQVLHAVAVMWRTDYCSTVGSKCVKNSE